MFERRLPGRSAIVGLLEGVNRAGKRAARRVARVYTPSVHVHQAAEPSSPASPTPLHAHVSTTNQENVRMVPCLAARRQQCAARRNSPHFFRSAGNLPTSLLDASTPYLAPDSRMTYLGDRFKNDLSRRPVEERPISAPG